MATVGTSKRSDAGIAASRVMDAEMDAINAGGESRFGSRVAFVGSDLVTDEMITEYHADGMAVVVVDERGHERFLPAP